MKALLKVLRALLSKKRPEVDPGMNYLVAGLGNIGAEYASTRHNMGFMVLDAENTKTLALIAIPGCPIWKSEKAEEPALYSPVKNALTKYTIKGIRAKARRKVLFSAHLDLRSYPRYFPKRMILNVLVMIMPPCL